MKPDIFIAIFNTRIKNADKSQEKILNTVSDLIKPKKYISYDNKLKIVDLTLEQTADSKHPTADRYRQFICNLISAYTEINMDLKAFDLLSENKMIDIILSSFEDEYEFCTF